jgi:hypothetical protein
MSMTAIYWKDTIMQNTPYRRSLSNCISIISPYIKFQINASQTHTRYFHAPQFINARPDTNQYKILNIDCLPGLPRQAHITTQIINTYRADYEIFLQVAAIVTVIITVPTVSHAESTQTVRLTQIRAELIQLQKVGYFPNRASDTRYPADIQAAQAHVAALNELGGGVGSTGGSSASGIAASAIPTVGLATKSIYFGGR